MSDVHDDEHRDGDASGDEETGALLPDLAAADVPAFCTRLLEHLAAEEPEGVFTFDDMEGENVAGLWMVGLAGYLPDEHPDPAAARADLQRVVDFTTVVRSAMRQAWGRPAVHEPRRVGADQEPEGILDHLLLAVGAPEAELWERGGLWLALLTYWSGDGDRRSLRQMLLVLPREMVVGGWSAYVDDDLAQQPRLMHGESPLELHRRAWLLAALLGDGERRVRTDALLGVRCGVRLAGLRVAWAFADDGRIVLAAHDATCAAATTLPQQLVDDHDLHGSARASDGLDATDAAQTEAADVDASATDEALRGAAAIVAARILASLPGDLRALLVAEEDRPDGVGRARGLEPADELGTPLVTFAAWFDGDVWRVPSAIFELGAQNDLGLADFGFDAAVRRLSRLGGAFTPETFAPEGPRRDAAREAFAHCPHPEQPRPEGVIRLGMGAPDDATPESLVADVERFTAARWRDASADDDLRVARRTLRHDDGVWHAALAEAESWTIDVLQQWHDGIRAAMDARWGSAQAESAARPFERAHRSPLATTLEAFGVQAAPAWWVNGHRVVLAAGSVDDGEGGSTPTSSLGIARADAAVHLMAGMDPWPLRYRTRLVAETACIVSGTGEAGRAQTIAAFDGMAVPLDGSELVPDVRRVVLRAGGHRWVLLWTHRTVGPRAIAFSLPVGEAETSTFDEQAARFAGVPEALLELVCDRDPDGAYAVVTRPLGDADASDALGRARTLPAAQMVLWLDGVDWRVSDAVLQAAHEAGVAASAGTGIDTADPLAVIFGPEHGLWDLRGALAAGYRLGVETLADPRYAELALDRPATPDEVADATARIVPVRDAAIGGALVDVLDAIDELDGFADLRSLLDLALSNPQPRARREIALWLLERPIDASIATSFLAPMNVLFENPALDADDAVLVRRLLARGALVEAGHLGATVGGHPVVQLVQRDLDEDAVLALLEPLLDAGVDVTEPWAIGRAESVKDAVERVAAAAPRPRERVVALVRAAAAEA